MKNRYLLFLAVFFLLCSGIVWLLQRAQSGRSFVSAPYQQEDGAQQTSSTTSTTPQSNGIIDLKDGDNYTVTAEHVSKMIAGKTIDAITYNGTIPGPTIRVAQGSQIHLTLVNRTGADTLLHPHGIRTANAFDGTTLTQQPIHQGESFTYDLNFPDVGVYWYHSHLDEAKQQDLGLYGNFIVTPTSTAYWSPVNREEVLTLDDILLNGSGVVSYGQGSANYGLMGRYGNTMLVNGQTDYQLNAKKGEVIRFYLTNTANARPFNLAFQGAKMKLVGGDNGKYEREQWADHVILGPSERVIIEVLFDQLGSYKLVNDTPSMSSNLATVSVSDQPIGVSYAQTFNVLRTNQDVIASIDPFRASFSKDLDKTIVLDSKMMGNVMGGGMMGGHSMGMMGSLADDGIEWSDTMPAMNATMSAKNARWTIIDEATGQTNEDVNWSFNKGDMVKIRIKNPNTGMHPMQHPIHFHGQRFLVLNIDGVSTNDFVWKDTVLVPAGKTVDILVDMSNLGQWMAHCHISEHLESGMMLKYTVR